MYMSLIIVITTLFSLLYILEASFTQVNVFQGSNNFDKLGTTISGNNEWLFVSDDPTSGNNNVYVYRDLGSTYNLFQTLTKPSGVFGQVMAFDQENEVLAIGEGTVFDTVALYKFSSTWTQVASFSCQPGSQFSYHSLKFHEGKLYMFEDYYTLQSSSLDKRLWIYRVDLDTLIVENTQILTFSGLTYRSQAIVSSNHLITKSGYFAYRETQNDNSDHMIYVLKLEHGLFSINQEIRRSTVGASARLERFGYNDYHLFIVETTNYNNYWQFHRMVSESVYNYETSIPTPGSLSGRPHEFAFLDDNLMVLITSFGEYQIYATTQDSTLFTLVNEQFFYPSRNVPWNNYVTTNNRIILSLSSDSTFRGIVGVYETTITQPPTIPPPTEQPTRAPSGSPTTGQPSTTPTKAPSMSPTTKAPSQSPTSYPTRNPTGSPTLYPTRNPTGSPTLYPTRSPSNHPTTTPSRNPTISPTNLPSTSPSVSPTGTPTVSPSSSPSQSPTFNPSKSPTNSPTLYPTRNPTGSPTHYPTKSPTGSPTHYPTRNPTGSPTVYPTKSPTGSPTHYPTRNPTPSPSKHPTLSPTASPTLAPKKAFMSTVEIGLTTGLAITTIGLIIGLATSGTLCTGVNMWNLLKSEPNETEPKKKKKRKKKNSNSKVNALEYI